MKTARKDLSKEYINKLINLSRKRGYLTYKTIKTQLDSKEYNRKELNRLIAALQRQGIEVVVGFQKNRSKEVFVPRDHKGIEGDACKRGH